MLTTSRRLNPEGKLIRNGVGKEMEGEGGLMERVKCTVRSTVANPCFSSNMRQ